MLENPEAVVFSARFDVETGISKLRHTKQESDLTPEHTLMIEQVMHDLWEVCKRMRYLEEHV
jgi:hypothetical protein